MPTLAFAEDYQETYPTHMLEGTQPEQKIPWEDTLADINGRVQKLLQENDLLMKEYESLKMQLNDVQYKVNEQKRKNVEWLDKSRSFQMPDVEEKAQELRRLIKDKQNEIADKQKDTHVIDKQISILEKKVEIKNIKIQEQQERDRVLKEKQALQASQNQQELALQMAQKEASLTDEVKQANARLEENSQREEALRGEIKDMQSPQESSADETAQWQKDNEGLQNQIASLEKERTEKLEKQKVVAQPELKEDFIKQKKEYLLALKDKTSLQADVVNLESELKVSQAQGSPIPVSWEAEKKGTVELIRNTDAANDKLREQVVNLKEDIYILKDRTLRLEDRMRIKDAVAERKKNLKKYQDKGYRYR